MEAFVRDPAEFVRKVMSRELDHNNDFADFDPSKKRAEIREKLIKLEEEQSLAKKQRKKEKARLLKMASTDDGSAIPALPTVQRSSPLKPPAAYADSRMVQSSPVKQPPPSMQKTGLRKSKLHQMSPSRRPPPIAEREAQDVMLFGDADGSPDELGREDESHIDQDNKQASIINYQQSFTDDLRQAAQHASQENTYAEDPEEAERSYELR
jgi:hypothetical protein